TFWAKFLTPNGHGLRRELEDTRARIREQRDRIALVRARNVAAQTAADLDALESMGRPHAPSSSATRATPSHVQVRPVYAYESDPLTGYPYVPVVRFEQFIGQNDPLFGWPVGQPLGYITALGQPLVGANSFPRELFPQFPQSLRTQIAQDATRLESRLYYETLEFYKAPLDHLVHYSVGGGLTWDCVSKEDESLAQAVSDWLEEWGKRNRLWRLVPESVLNLLGDGETFTRTWDTDEYPEAVETEASWIRGPHNEIYGPWAMGCLCPQWPKRFDKITAFNLWYPDNTQEQLAPTMLVHTKLGASNVKRGIPLSY